MAAPKEVKVKFTGDSSGASKAAEHLEAVVKKISAGIQADIKRIDGFDRLQRRVSDNKAAFQSLRESARALAGDLGSASAAADSLGKVRGLRSLQQQIVNVSSSLDKAKAVARDLSTQAAGDGTAKGMNAAVRTATSLESKLASLIAQEAELSSALKGAGVDTARLTAEQTRLGAQARLVAPLTASYKELETELQKIEGALKRDQAAAGVAAAALDKAGISVDRLAHARSRLEAQRTAAVRDATNAAKLDIAQQALGVRSYAQIEAQIKNVNAALSTLRSAGTAPREMARASEAAKRQVAALRAEIRGVQADSRSLSLPGRDIVAGVLSAAGLSQFTKMIVESNDQMAGLQGRLRAYIDDEKELVEVQAALYKVAQQTRQPLESTVDLYARLVTQKDALKANNAELIEFTKLVGQAIALGGSSPQASAGALMQLSQALGSARVQAEEYNSLLDGAPVVLQTMAAHIDEAGGSVSKLTQLVKAGKISNVDLFRSMLAGSADVEMRSLKMQRTVGQALTQLRNDLKAANASSNMAPLIESLDALREVVSDPNFSSNIAAIGTAVARLVGLGAEGLSEFATFGQRLGLIAAELTGNAAALDVLGAEIEDVDRALKNSFMGKPTRFLFTSDTELKALKTQLVAERDAILAAQGAAPDSPEGKQARIASLTVQVDTLSKAYDTLNASVASGDSVRNGRLASDAKQLDELSKKLADYRAQLADLSKVAPANRKPGGQVSASGPGDSTRKSESAEDRFAIGVDHFKDAIGSEDAAIKARFDVMTATLRAEGKEVEAQALEARRAILDKLGAAGMDSSSDEASKLLGLTDARTQLNALQKDAADSIEELQRYSSALSLAVEAGSLKASEAQDLFLEKMEAARPAIQANLSAIGALNDAIGDDAQKVVSDLAMSFDGLAASARGPFAQLLQNWNDTASQLEEVGASAAQSIVDSLADAAVSGEFSFKRMADQIIAELIRIQLQQMMMKLLGSIPGIGPGLALLSGAAMGGGGGSSYSGTLGSYDFSGFASGGVVGKVSGPGSGTSDSIAAGVADGSYVMKSSTVAKQGGSVLDKLKKLAADGLNPVRLSNGEEVIPPAITRQIGVGTLDKINDGRLDLSSFLSFAKGLRGFASGGFVGREFHSGSALAKATGSVSSGGAGGAGGPNIVVQGDSIDARGADAGSVAQLRALLDSRDRALKSDIAEMIQRRRF